MINFSNYNRINNLLGWIVFAIAATTYILTMEQSGSFWDCGEFASCAYTLQTPHPPGAPLFILVGRVFVILFGGMFGGIVAINLLSALSSAFTILFLFWTITFFAKKLTQHSEKLLSSIDIINIMSAGVVGALAFTFSDTFWFNAVESEVYAMSSFFSALSFWTIIRWNSATDKKDPYADKWLIFIAFTIGIAIGVHLLNILTIPAVVFFYYFKKYPTTKKGIYITFLIACAMTGIIQKVIIQSLPSFAAKFDLVFVNSFNLPFYSGVFFFVLLLIVLFYFLLKRAIQKSWYVVKLLTWCSVFIIIGFCTYAVPLIRSNANTPIDMYNVDNIQTLIGYLSREQYGDFPLVYGQSFTAKPISREETGSKYRQFKDKYVEIGKSSKDIFATSDKMFFPRVWDYNNQQNHIHHYKMWLNLQDGEKPSFADNIKWFVAYQMNWMYFRYFMWNFAGRQNDIQNVDGNVRDGNWISGIPFIDNIRLGDQSKVPNYMQNMESRNTLFMLPFLLGVLGMVFQYKKSKKDFTVVGLLFFFTGIAIAIYLNMPGNQPRERDYAFVGSFYTFAIWIGLGVLFVADLLSKKINTKMAVILSATSCFIAVPLLMGLQEWGDHDRGQKTLVKDIAINYLQSCPKNAVLFCYGDNDTYPLWYAQQVEGIRPDVRVVNTALLGAEWYVNQLRYKLDSSERVKLPYSEEKTIGSNNDIVFFNINNKVNNRFYPLDTILNLAIEQRKFEVRTQSGLNVASLPVSKFTVSANEENVRKNNQSIYPSDIIDPNPQLVIPEKYTKDGYLFRSDLAVLATIAAFKWERPICFTSPTFINDFQLERYARSNGLVYELVPVRNNNGININWMLDKMNNNDWSFSSLKNQSVYYNEEGRRTISTLRNNYIDLTSALLRTNRKEEARRVFNRCLIDLPIQSLAITKRHDRFNSSYFLALKMVDIAQQIGDTVSFNQLYESLEVVLEQENQYFQSMSSANMARFSSEISLISRLLEQLRLLKKAQEETEAKLGLH